ncbi:MAG: DUF2147 domain-containing protein [Spirochaetaceae bacterium]|jgi:uncharacterized protein (DUF2147 family)|nr:DUF2147 domain-containing protein [Spirochaetaceae bacterium]
MRKGVIFFIVLSVLGILGAGLCFADDPAVGYWISVDDKTGKTTAGWELYLANGTLQGRIISLADYPADIKAALCKASYSGFPVAGKVNEMPVVGTPWIYGLKMTATGRWTQGSIIDPESGNLYKCKITYHAAGSGKYTADTLEMRGEIGLGIGRSQFWRKSTRQEASGLR